jgi:Zn-dependent protease with chaperone function
VIELALVLVAAGAAVTFGSSLLCAVGLRVGWRQLGGLSPAAQSRVLLAATVLPAVVCGVLLAAMAFDLVLHRCGSHRCLVYGSVGPSLFSAGLALLATARLGHRGWRALGALRHTRSVARALERVSSGDGAESRIVPVDEPQAFVVGLRRPRMYLSRGLLQHTDARDLESVIAHERYHIQRRDPMRRLIASFCLAFHLPGVARTIERRLVATLARAAAAAPARALGDAPRVAEALVRLARLRMTHVPLAVGMLDSDLEFRVRELLNPATRPDRPGTAVLVGCGSLGFAAALLAADPVHGVFEALVRLLAAG